MKREPTLSQTRQIPAFKVNVNTSDFQYRKSSLKQKLQKEYLPYYWQKCGMDQKVILESGEDRLSELTTGQIDRIIDMEKIKSLLYDRKRKVQEAYFDYDQTNPSAHQNIYQANFLAKINEIAIKRNIRHEDLEGFDELIQQRLEKIKMKTEQRKKLVMPYKYAKRYRANASDRKVKTQLNEDEQVRSIDSIQDDLEQFEEKIASNKVLKRSQTNRQKGSVLVNKLLPPKRWFYGMSTYYLSKSKPQKMPEKQQVCKTQCYDIECEVKLINELRSSSFHSKDRPNITQSTASSKNRERLLSHKINHITMLKFK